MTGHRIKQARLAAGFTLEEVVKQMKKLGESITRQGLSNYENNKRGPGPATLMKLARALRVKPAYFMMEPGVTIAWAAYRRHPDLPKREQETIEAFAQTACERQMYLQTTLFPNEKPAFPPKTKVHTLDDAEASATKLRRHWALGTAAIESLAQTIENYGGMIVEYPTDGGTFDGLSGWVNENFPLIIVNPRVPDDRIRFNLAHELGHLVMDCDSASENEEDLAYRFAEALLVPATVAIKELGEKRRALMFEELGVLKRKYGFSMQGWLYRAWHLGIIRESYFKTMRAEFNKKSWKRVEPVQYEGDEKPTRLHQMALRALSEGVITWEKAEELCPGCTEGIETSEETKAYSLLSPSELLKRPISERRAILAQLAKIAEKEYQENRDLTDFEAFGEDDLQDE